MIQEDKSITRKNLPDGFYQIVILGATVHDNKSGQGLHLKIAYDIVALKNSGFILIGTTKHKKVRTKSITASHISAYLLTVNNIPTQTLQGNIKSSFMHLKYQIQHTNMRKQAINALI